jgi:hypothetical protein
VCVFPFYEASHVQCRRRAPLLAEPDQTPHITMWHYGYGLLLRCGCAGSICAGRGFQGMADVRARSCWGTAGAHRSIRGSNVRLRHNTGGPRRHAASTTCAAGAPRKIQKYNRTVAFCAQRRARLRAPRRGSRPAPPPAPPRPQKRHTQRTRVHVNHGVVSEAVLAHSPARLRTPPHSA